jgi:hypothetical protein
MIESVKALPDVRISFEEAISKNASFFLNDDLTGSVWGAFAGSTGIVRHELRGTWRMDACTVRSVVHKGGAA